MNLCMAAALLCVSVSWETEIPWQWDPSSGPVEWYEVEWGGIHVATTTTPGITLPCHDGRLRVTAHNEAGAGPTSEPSEEEIRCREVSSDTNGDGFVTSADFSSWRRLYLDGSVSSKSFNGWRRDFLDACVSLPSE